MLYFLLQMSNLIWKLSEEKECLLYLPMFFPKFWSFSHIISMTAFSSHSFSPVFWDSSDKTATTPSMEGLSRVIFLEEDMGGQALFHLYHMTSSAC